MKSIHHLKKKCGTSLKLAKIESVFSFWSFPQNSVHQCIISPDFELKTKRLLSNPEMFCLYNKSSQNSYLQYGEVDSLKSIIYSEKDH